jgi:hypothetical protein
VADPGERKENTAIAVVYLALARYAADRHDHGAPADLNKLVSNQRVRSVWWGQCWKLIHRQQIMRRLGSAVALEVSTRCDDDEPQLICYPHRDHVAFEQRPIRIIRDYRVLTLPLHLRTRGRSVLPNMIAGDECHHPLHEAASPFPDPGVMSAGYLH